MDNKAADISGLTDQEIVDALKALQSLIKGQQAIINLHTRQFEVMNEAQKAMLTSIDVLRAKL